MSVRIAFAAALRLLRTKRGLTQLELSKNLTQSHVSQIESEKTSPSLDAIVELARVLKLSPVALMAVACAAQDGLSADEILTLAEKDLQLLALLEVSIPLDTEDTAHPRVAAAAKTREKVQALKEQGFSQAEIARELGMAKTTVQRHWHRSE